MNFCVRRWFEPSRLSAVADGLVGDGGEEAEDQPFREQKQRVFGEVAEDAGQGAEWGLEEIAALDGEGCSQGIAQMGLFPLSRRHAVVQQEIGQVGEIEVLQGFEDEVIILAAGQLGVIGAQAGQDRAAEAEGGVGKGIGADGQAADGGRGERIAALGGDLRGGVDDADAAAGAGQFRLLAQQGYLPFEAEPVGDIVTVHDGKEIGLGVGQFEEMIAGGGDAAVDAVAMGLQAWVGVGEVPEAFPAAVGRAVIEGDQFKVGPALVQDGGDRLVQVGESIVDRHQDRYNRHGRPPEVLPKRRRGRRRHMEMVEKKCKRSSFMAQASTI